MAALVIADPTMRTRPRYFDCPPALGTTDRTRYFKVTLSDTVDGYRHPAFLADQAGDSVALELRHRQCARSQHVSRDVVNNSIWCQLVTAAVNLLAWAKRLTPHLMILDSSSSPPLGCET